MAGSFEDFLLYINAEEPDHPEKITILFLSYCTKNFPEMNLSLYRHEYKPEFQTLLSGKNSLPKELNKNLKKLDRGSYQIENKILVPIPDHRDLVRFIVLINTAQTDFDEELFILLRAFSNYMKSLYSQIARTSSDQILHHANLISQVTHDFTSFLNQVDRQSLTLARKSYAENMLKQLLFYIRDFDLEFCSVPLSEYIEGVVSEIKQPSAGRISVRGADTIATISIDVELFSKALLNIIDNAIDASPDNIGTITLEIFRLPQESPFITNDWIVFKISDSGCGIHADYLSMVKNPFFTTRKMEEHCGLGLSIAEKIINAHQGIIDIKKNETGPGTTALIYLPEITPK
jgi:signal transduction histidine kinase